MKRIILSLLIIIGSSINGISGNNDPVRIEIEAQLDNDNLKLIPCKQYGVLIFYKSVRKTETNERIWVFTLYDKNLNRVSDFEIPVIENVYYYGYVKDDKSAYMVFYNAGGIKADEYNIQLLRYLYRKKEFQVIKAIVNEKAELIDYEVGDQKVFLGFNIKKHDVNLYLADFVLKSFKTISIEDNNRNHFEDIYIDTVAKKARILLNNFISRKENQLKIISYDYEGEICGNYFIRPNDEETEINSARMIALGKNSQLIIGTYNNAAAQSSELRNEDEIISAGVYISRITNDNMDYLNRYNFLDYRNFYANINASAVFKLKQKSDKNDNDKDYSLNYRLLLHDIIVSKDQYILLAEAYYPDYKTVSYITYDYYGRPFPQTYSVFNGYVYFSGILSSFNSEGNLLWDNGIKIWDVVTFDLQKHIISFNDNSDLILAYCTQNKIASEIYFNGNVVGDFNYVDIKSKYPKDKVMEDVNSYMVEWYDKYFLCFGYQEIRNNSLPDKNKRSVFYVNKIAFD